MSPEVVALHGQSVGADAGVNAHRNLIVDFFATHSATYEIRAQLCTGTGTMPIEDATVPWPEDESPHRTVATIRFDVQDPYTPQRRAYGDDVLSPARATRCHRPAPVTTAPPAHPVRGAHLGGLVRHQPRAGTDSL